MFLLGNAHSTGTGYNLCIRWLNLKYLAIETYYFVVIQKYFSTVFKITIVAYIINYILYNNFFNKFRKVLRYCLFISHRYPHISHHSTVSRYSFKNQKLKPII